MDRSQVHLPVVDHCAGDHRSWPGKPLLVLHAVVWITPSRFQSTVIAAILITVQDLDDIAPISS